MVVNDVYVPSSERYDGAMPYVRCGRSGVRLPAVSLGLWHNFGSLDDFDNSSAIALRAFDSGITCFDLANNYGPVYGSAEETFGRILKSSLMPYRDELFITTKAGYDMWPGPYGNWGSRKYLMSSLDQSLKRMGLDYVDLFYSHRYDPETPLEETLQALVDIVRQGKALYAGISNYPVETLDYVFNYMRCQNVPCLIYQGRFNMLDCGEQKMELMRRCSEAGVGFTAFSPLAQGLLTDRYLDGNVPAGSRMARNVFLKSDVLTERLLSKLNSLQKIAAGRGQSLSEMALSWILQKREVTSVIIGASSVGQLDVNVKCVRNTAFTQDELDAIDVLITTDRIV